MTTGSRQRAPCRDPRHISHCACTTSGVTIHHSHPFAVGEQDRNPLRRFRGRMASPVSIWAATAHGTRAGWTLSSFLVADGEPGEVIGLIDEESPLADVLAEWPTPSPAWHPPLAARLHSATGKTPTGVRCWRTHSAGSARDSRRILIMLVGVCCCGPLWNGSRSNPMQPTTCCATYAVGTVPFLANLASVASAPCPPSC
jgi:hypothetical protein